MMSRRHRFGELNCIGHFGARLKEHGKGPFRTPQVTAPRRWHEKLGNLGTVSQEFLWEPHNGVLLIAAQTRC
jgi:hypothetical protein